MAALIIYAVIDAKNKVAPPKTEQTVNNTSSDTSTDEPKVVMLDPEKTELAVEGGIIEKSLSKILINVIKTPEGRSFLEHIVRPANSPLSGEYTLKINNDSFIKDIFKTKIVTEGEGPKVSCGHIVTVDYQITNSRRFIVESGKKTFALGSRDVIIGLNNVIVGMRKGESKIAQIHKHYAYESPYFKGKPPVDPTDYYIVKVSLIEAIPHNFIDDSVKIFDDEVSYSIPYLCGDNAIFDANIMKIDGTSIYDSKTKGKQISMILGDGLYPMIFSHALFNKTPFGTRTVICKGQYLRGL